MRNMSSAKHNIIAAVHRYSLGGVTVAGTVRCDTQQGCVFGGVCLFVDKITGKRFSPKIYFDPCH